MECYRVLLNQLDQLVGTGAAPPASPSVPTRPGPPTPPPQTLPSTDATQYANQASIFHVTNKGMKFLPQTTVVSSVLLHHDFFLYLCSITYEALLRRLPIVKQSLPIHVQ